MGWTLTHLNAIDFMLPLFNESCCLHVAGALWAEAEKELVDADKICVIGYSFPKTDIRTDVLFRSAFLKRTTIPEINILNPAPDAIAERFIYDFGIPEDRINVQKGFFDDTYKSNLFGYQNLLDFSCQKSVCISCSADISKFLFDCFLDFTSAPYNKICGWYFVCFQLS